MKFSRYDEKHYVITDFSSLNIRKIGMIIIFIRGLSNIDLWKTDNQIDIIINSEDEPAIANLLTCITQYIKKQCNDFEVSDDVKIILNDYHDYEEERKKTKEKLESLLEINASELSEYDSFCKDCNNLIKIKLRPYQYKAAYSLSIGHGGFNFSVPGAGKTIITYAAYAYMKHNKSIDHIFIIGPNSSYNAWHDEYTTCFEVPPPIENLADETTDVCKNYLMASVQYHSDITFINMEKIRLMTNHIIKFINQYKTLLVIDEAHKIKNPDAAVTKSALEISKVADARIILTGTPMPNGYEDLYSLCMAYSPFESILPFQYSQLKRMSKNETGELEISRIRKAIAPFYSRISKKYLLENKELMPSHSNIVTTQMDSDQQILYNRLENFIGKMNDNIEEDILQFFKRAILIRKMQISANPALLRKSLLESMDELRLDYTLDNNNLKDSERLVEADNLIMKDFMDSNIVKIITRYDQSSIITPKNKMVIAICSKLFEQNKKIIIWDIFIRNMEILKTLLSDAFGNTVEMINGTVCFGDRQTSINKFREGSSKILLANPATLAESISLHRVCQDAIYVNRNFNAAQYIQSKDRIHRINMPEGTTANYFYILNDDSVDGYVHERLNFKENRMLSILDADDIVCGGSDLEETSIMSDVDIENGYMR